MKKLKNIEVDCIVGSGCTCYHNSRYLQSSVRISDDEGIRNARECGEACCVAGMGRFTSYRWNSWQRTCVWFYSNYDMSMPG